LFLVFFGAVPTAPIFKKNIHMPPICDTEKSILKQYEKGNFYTRLGLNCYLHSYRKNRKIAERRSPNYQLALNRLVKKNILKLKNNIYEIYNDK